MSAPGSSDQPLTSLSPNVSADAMDHGPVSDAAIGRALSNLRFGGDDQAETDKSSAAGPLQQRDLEMVTTEHRQSYYRNRPEENDDDSDIRGKGKLTNNESSIFGFPPVQSQSSAEWIDRKFYKEKLRKLPPSITDAYDNWTCENEAIASTNRNSRIKQNDNGDEIAWKIIRGILQGWCAIWVLFAIIIVAAEVTSPKTPHRVSNNNIALIVSEEDEQSFLMLSEKVVSKCSYSNLDTETGREECQSLCHQHMCCFNDENNFGCSDNPEKMCAAYAGCESLIVAEDDAIIYDASGVDVFGIGDADSDSDPLAGNSSDNSDESNEQSQNESVSYATSELQLISDVISTVCSTGNLHTKRGLNECVGLCNDSMCCFDRKQIEFLNPNMDLILQLQGITAEILDTSTMGTCTDGSNKEHFCQVHASCKNLLLLGSHYSGVDNLNSDGTEGDASAGNYLVFSILFALVAALTVYLLVFQRAGPVHVDVSRIRGGTTAREEMIEFV